jgi:sirohydrochlorin ferrochelatase
VTGAPLVLIAHGSTDRRFADVVQAVAARVRELRPHVEVRIGYLEHGTPSVADVAADGVLVPLLLASGHHVLVDLPRQAPDATVSRAVGPDERLAVAVADRLREAGYAGESPVVLAAAGSREERALNDVRVAAQQLAAVLGVEVSAAFVASGSPRLTDLLAATPAAAVASYLVAPGGFHDAVGSAAAAASSLASAPIGDHPAVAHVVLSRYDECITRGGSGPF